MNKKIFNMRFWNQYKIYIQCPLDQILRYLPVIDYIKKKNYLCEKIVEVGSGDSGITRFYPIGVTGVDLHFYKPNTLFLKPVVASVTNLPFEDKSCEVVISIDLLEHINADSRRLAIEEMIRITKRTLILGFPCGELTAKYERKFNDLYKNKFGVDHPWIVEHLVNGLPKVKEIFSIINEILLDTKGYRIKIYNNVNILLWYLSRIANLKGNYYLLPLRGRFAPLLMYIWKHINFGNCYRKIIIIEFCG